LASSISATVNLGLLYFFLRKKIGSIGEREIMKAFFQMLLAGAVMVLFARVYEDYALSRVVDFSRWVQFFTLVGGIGLCGVVYFSTCRLIGIKKAGNFFYEKSEKIKRPS